MADSNKLDMFEVLRRINHKDYHWFDSLSDDQQKTFIPLVTTRWASGTSDARQIIFINEIVNKYTFLCSTKHKGLLYRLLCICTNDINRRYKWLKRPKRGSSMPITVNVIKEYVGCNTNHALDNIHLLTLDDILQMGSELGYTKTEISKIKKEHK